MSGALSPTHWLIIIGVVVVLFGAKKLPDAARGLGQSLRIFRAELSASQREAAAGDEPPTGRPPVRDDSGEATRGTTVASGGSSSPQTAVPRSGDAAAGPSTSPTSDPP